MKYCVEVGIGVSTGTLFSSNSKAAAKRFANNLIEDTKTATGFNRNIITVKVVTKDVDYLKMSCLDPRRKIEQLSEVSIYPNGEVKQND